MMEILKAFNKIIGRPQNVQASGNAVHTLDIQHAASAKGEGYYYSSKFYIAGSGYATIAVHTGANKHVHFLGYSITADLGPIEISYRQNISITSGSGVEIYPLNRRLDISSHSEMRMFAGVTFASSGTIVSETVNLATESQGGKNIGAVSQAYPGLILDTDTSYGIVYHNTDSSTATIWTTLSYQEPGTL